MPTRFFFSSKFSRLAPLAAVLTALAVSSAVAQEADEPNELQKLFGAMGLLDLPKDPIDYQERSPLVVPPSADLPKPGATADLKQINPEWPIDQDIKQRKAAAKEAKKPIDAPTDSFYSGRRLNNTSEVKGQRIEGGADVMSEAEKRGQYRSTLSDLGFKGWDKKNEVKFEKEPDRTSLLQPPPGYRTPSSNAPYGIVEEDRNISPAYSKDRNDDRNKR